MKPTLVIMAAGMGSRYGGLKQIDPVGPGGEIMMDYSAYDAIRAGFGKLVFVIRKDIADAFRDVVEPHWKKRIAIDYAFQELDDLPSPFTIPPGRTKPWGTTHAILSCRHNVAEPFGVINADDFYGRRSFDLLSQFLQQRRPNETLYALIGFLLKNTLSEHGHVSRGICEVDSAGHLKTVTEHPRIEPAQAAEFPADTIASMNMWGFTPAIFPQLESVFIRHLESRIADPKSESYIPAAVDQLIQSGRATVAVKSSPDSWLGMTHPADKPVVKAGIANLIQRGEYPSSLWT